MSYTSVANPPLHDGAHFDDVSDIPNPCEGDLYMHSSTGNIVVLTNGKWGVITSGVSGTNGIPGNPGIKGPDPTFQVMERTMFMEALRELAIFKKIEESEYFKLKRLYESVDVENRLLASNLVTEFHNKLDKGV